MSGYLTIVGYMGSGKTTVGRLIARKLGWEFVDLDHAIVREAGRSIPEIFADSGEDHFRDLESLVLKKALAGPAERVIACGGGVIVRSENRERLRAANTVFLEEDLDLLYGRTRGSGRPLRAADRREFEERYAARLPHYLEVADLHVEVGGRRAEQIAEEIAQWLCA
ncbi:MAG TPA: shikimate kinase [Rubrobacteraceae bacterium]|nr:shikimate kinase [Rubrobacteraceae bacterium]